MTNEVFRETFNFCESQHPHLCLKTQLVWAFIINIRIAENVKEIALDKIKHGMTFCWHRKS